MFGPATLHTLLLSLILTAAAHALHTTLSRLSAHPLSPPWPLRGQKGEDGRAKEWAARAPARHLTKPHTHHLLAHNRSDRRPRDRPHTHAQLHFMYNVSVHALPRARSCY